jgi:hypothetical protein
MGSPSPPDNGSSRNGRLDGWKDIAAYVGRGVRTAQRWERELGLPIHRLRTGSGEVVYAERAEIDAWLVKQSDDNLARGDGGRDANGQNGNGRNGNGKDANGADGNGIDANSRDDGVRGGASASGWRWRAMAGVAGAIALAALAVAGWALSGRSSPGDAGIATALTPALPQPVSLAPSTDTLIAFGADGRQVWQYPFKAPLVEYNPQRPAAFRQAWDIQDIEGDGSSEAIFARASPSDPRVYCFNSDGSVRFDVSIDTPVRFGEYACPPVMLTHVFREQRPDFPGTFLVAGHHPLHFPAVLRRLDAQGHTAGEYWSNGYILLVTSVEIDGRWATLVGGAHNETGGASLAVFFGNIEGSAPATRTEYACDGCPAGAPDIFLVFPRSRQQGQLRENAFVNNVSVVGPDRLSVGVVNAGTPDSAQHCCGYSYYTLDRDFRVVATELGGSYWPLQRALEAEHRVTAGSRFREPADFYPVRRWNGSGWDLVSGPERPIAR